MVRIAYLFRDVDTGRYAVRILRMWEMMVRGAYPTGEYGGLPAVLCAGRVVLFHRGDGTVGGDSGQRLGAGFVTRGISGLSATLALSGGRPGDAPRSPARHLDLAAGRCRLFQTLGCDQKTLHPILVGGGRQRTNLCRIPAIAIDAGASGNAGSGNTRFAINRITQISRVSLVSAHVRTLKSNLIPT